MNVGRFTTCTIIFLFGNVRVALEDEVVLPLDADVFVCHAGSDKFLLLRDVSQDPLQIRDLSRRRVRVREERLDLVRDRNADGDRTDDLRLIDEDVAHVEPSSGFRVPQGERICSDLSEVGRRLLHLLFSTRARTRRS